MDSWGRVSAQSFSRYEKLISIAGLVVLAVVTYALAEGWFTGVQAGAVVLGPVLAAAALFRPGWMLLALVAVPPGLMTRAPSVTIPLITLILAGVLAFLVVVRGRFYLGAASGVLPLAVLLLAAYSWSAGVGPAAALRADQVLQSLLSYVVILLLSYNLTRMGALSNGELRIGLELGILLVAVVFLAEVVATPFVVSPEPGLLLHRTHLGYVMAMGFGLSLSRPLLRPASDRSGTAAGRSPVWGRFLARDILGIAFYGACTLLSQTRGAWVAALITITAVSWMTQRRTYWLLVPLAAVTLTTIPVMNERLFSDLSGGLRQSIETGQIGTGRWRLWNELWDLAVPALPLGKGFGYTWSLTSHGLFGIADQFASARTAFIFPHNDFLFWMLELGLIGVGTAIAFWAHLVVAMRRAFASVIHQGAVVSFVGIIASAFVASMVDNALFIRPVSERLFLVAGFLFALASQTRTAPPESPSQWTPDLPGP